MAAPGQLSQNLANFRLDFLQTFSQSLANVLEAQQRYFSYRTILVAIVSQNFFVLIYNSRVTQLQNGVSHRCACVRLSANGGGESQHFGGLLTSLKKYRAIRGIAAIVSQYHAGFGATKANEEPSSLDKKTGHVKTEQCPLKCTP